jgi:hypothetical protein
VTPVCEHPFEWLLKEMKASRNDLGLLLTISFECAQCDADLGTQQRQFKTKVRK